MVNIDWQRVNQVLHNLLENAVAYTHKGGTINVAAMTQGNWIEVSVSDTGEGIPAEDLPNIFERFYRVDKARSRAKGGAGLGLSICQHIAGIHDGRIEVESQVGQGSTFPVFLPLLEKN